MQNEERAAPEKLPDTGIPQETEEALSSVFVRMPGYQTRSTSVLFRTEKGIHFTEKNCLNGEKNDFWV